MVFDAVLDSFCDLLLPLSEISVVKGNDCYITDCIKNVNVCISSNIQELIWFKRDMVICFY